MTLHGLYLAVLAVALAASGSAGSDAIPGAASEEDVAADGDVLLFRLSV